MIAIYIREFAGVYIYIYLIIGRRGELRTRSVNYLRERNER